MISGMQRSFNTFPIPFVNFRSIGAEHSYVGTARSLCFLGEGQENPPRSLLQTQKLFKNLPCE